MLFSFLFLGFALAFSSATEEADAENEERFFFLGKATTTYTSYIITTTSISTISVNYCYSTLAFYGTYSTSVTTTTSGTFYSPATTNCRKRRWALENPINLELLGVASPPVAIQPSEVADLRIATAKTGEIALIESSQGQDVNIQQSAENARFNLAFVTTVVSTLTSTTFVATANSKSTIRVACIPAPGFGLTAC